MTFPGEPHGERHRLLETLRLYGQERSVEAGEQPWLLDRHVEYFLTLVEDAHGRLFRAEEADTLKRLDAETANFRLALRRALDGGRGETALRLAIGLSRLWKVHGHWAEGRGWLEAGLSVLPHGESSLRARAEAAAAVLTLQQGEFAVARSVGEHALILAREAGDDVTAAEALDCLHGVASEQGDFEHAETLLEDCLSTWRRSGAVSGTISSFAGSLLATGYDAYAHGYHERAATRLQEALTVARELHIARAQAGCLQYLAMVARAQGRLGEARRFVDEALAISETLHDARNLGALTNIRGLIALDEGNLGEPAQSGVGYSRPVMGSGRITPT